MNKKAIKYLNKYFKGNVEGKTIVITGGNSGIGREVARQCVYLKMKVIIAVRSLERGKIAIDDIKKEYPDADISMMFLDVSEEISIIDFVNEIIDRRIDIDIFYHNAGIYRVPFEVKEGKDIITSTNFYGPLMLTSLILPYLNKMNHDVKMIITGSIASRWAKIREDMLYPNKKLSRMRRYSNSKLLDSFLFKYLFNNDKSNVKYYLVHPGICYTPLFNKTYKKLFGKIVDIFMRIFANPSWKSALATMRIISDDAIEGKLYGPSCMFNAIGYPRINKFMDKYYGKEEAYIKKSEEIVGYRII